MQIAAPEVQHFETQAIRREVDRYKDDPSAAARRKMNQAFATLDAKVADMEGRASALTGDARAELDRQIANLKSRRDLHWTRAQEAMVQLEPIEKARPVAEGPAKVVKARPAGQAQTNAQRSRARRVYRQAPQAPQDNLFLRIGRLFGR